VCGIDRVERKEKKREREGETETECVCDLKETNERKGRQKREWLTEDRERALCVYYRKKRRKKDEEVSLCAGFLLFSLYSPLFSLSLLTSLSLSHSC
jgi:hypothetical protein